VVVDVVVDDPEVVDVGIVVVTLPEVTDTDVLEVVASEGVVAPAAADPSAKAIPAASATTTPTSRVGRLPRFGVPECRL
jgi:hypothetical protein